MQQEKGTKSAVDKELEDLKQHLEMYSEIALRLDFENAELLERQRDLNLVLQQGCKEVKIFVRIRSPILGEVPADKAALLQYEIRGDHELEVKHPDQGNKADVKKPRLLSFDQVLPVTASENDVFEEVESLVHNVIAGLNSTVVM